MKTIECPVCGKKALARRKGPGRTMKHRNMLVPVPDDFELPECSSCGARPLDWRTAERLDPLLEDAYQSRLASMAEADVASLAELRPLYEWERLLNLSAGYLSKLRGAKKPSAQLAALLRLLVNHPERRHELESLWEGKQASVVISERPRVRAAPQPLPPSKPQFTLVERGDCTVPPRAA